MCSTFALRKLCVECSHADGAGCAAGRRWNLTASGQLVSQMGAVAWSQGHSWATDPPAGVDGPCLVPQRGPPNMFGPLQLWSKPQPGGAAVLVASIGSTWGNDNTRSSAATFALSEIPGLPKVGHSRPLANDCSCLCSVCLLRAQPLARVDSPRCAQSPCLRILSTQLPCSTVHSASALRSPPK